MTGLKNDDDLHGEEIIFLSPELIDMAEKSGIKVTFYR